MSRSGWFIIKEEDADLPLLHITPDSTTGISVAVVVPPAASFPAFAPFNVDESIYYDDFLIFASLYGGR